MSDQKQSLNSTYVAVAIAFLAIAATFWLTTDNIAVALPFFVFAMSFLVFATMPTGGDSDTTDEAGDADKE
ncbi:hypothetical protein SK224_04970 [Microbacterium sp. BG28]|uniref:hypothetical protein n=1 Tax=Microbacterium sp. BG28 TaxID=3097356 RepID=UPI002A5A3AB2|nr:hypothetical protein [Microbacterium sp. BG28]MDY0828475.1 hypothetical protein [Microbacterium sp. BG28]